MKTIAIAFLALLAGPAAAQDDAEAKKKRLGQLMKQMTEIQKEGQKLLDELTGGDRSKIEAIMKEVMEKYAPEMSAEMGRSQAAASERNAASTLKTLATAQADFRANDRDGNRVQDFWVADVSGLYRIDPGEPIRLIEQSVATADAKPCVPLDKAGTLAANAKEHASKLVALGKPAAKAGYWFAAIERYEDDKGSGAKYDEGNGRNSSMFGLCSYPAEYGKAGKSTFILNEDNTIWKKDTGGKPVDLFPADPKKAGWSKLD
ncbi:MAG TPA: DUF2950 family protein [Planctomycetota bacterium]|nr:DUF2950 family protein [Planctomycetota bacterium]